MQHAPAVPSSPLLPPVKAQGGVRAAVRRLLVAMGVVAAIATGLAALALQAAPSVAPRAEIDPLDMQHLMALARAHDPRRLPAGQRSAIAATERDLDLLLQHVARRVLSAQTEIRIAHGRAVLRSSHPLALGPWPGWLNLELNLAETAGLPEITGGRLGDLPLPPVPLWLAERVAPALWPRSGPLAELAIAAQAPALARDLVHWVKFMPGQVHVVYAWQPGTTQRLLGALLPAGELQRLRAYSDQLVALSTRRPRRWEVPLSELMGPMFALARQRSAAGGDAAAENRSAIVALTLYASGRSLAAVLPGAHDWPRPRRMRVMLAGRDDFPRHFLISAALAAETTLPLSRAAGLGKELADARGGSGFSFNDMAANLAGTRFGEAALRRPGELQARLAAGAAEALFMPEVADLPEFMAEPEFLRRYGGVGAPAYAQQMAEIERRVAGLALFR